MTPSDITYFVCLIHDCLRALGFSTGLIFGFLFVRGLL